MEIILAAWLSASGGLLAQGAFEGDLEFLPQDSCAPPPRANGCPAARKRMPRPETGRPRSYRGRGKLGYAKLGYAAGNRGGM